MIITDCYKPPKVNQVKHILILLSHLILTSPLVAQETGVLYFKKVNGKYGWFKNGNDKKDWKYIGEIKNGKPNGTGVLSSTSGKYSGEVKNGMQHGQGTYTYKSGRKTVGEFRKSKPWNAKKYDKNGNSVITEVKKISKPGRRVYKGCDEIKRFKNGYGTYVVSTSKGVLSNDDAHKQKVGGEVLVSIW